MTWATPRTARIAHLAAIPVRVGQARRIYSFRFTQRVVVRSENGDVTSHWSDILLDYARAIGCDADDRRYRFVPTGADEREAQQLSAGSGRFIILNPCNAVASRRPIWPLEGWATLAGCCASGLMRRIARERSTTTRRSRRASCATAATTRSSRLPAHQRRQLWSACAQSRALLSASRPARCTSPPRSTARPSASFRFSRTFQSDGRPLGTRTAVVRASYPCHPGRYQRKLPRLRVHRASRSVANPRGGSAHYVADSSDDSALHL